MVKAKVQCPWWLGSKKGFGSESGDNFDAGNSLNFSFAAQLFVYIDCRSGQGSRTLPPAPPPLPFPQYSSNQSCGLNWGIYLRRYIFRNFLFVYDKDVSVSVSVSLCVCVCEAVTWPASRFWDFLRFCLRLRVEAASRQKFKVHIWWLLIEYLI